MPLTAARVALAVALVFASAGSAVGGAELAARLAAAQEAFVAAGQHAADPARSRAAYRDAARRFRALHDEGGLISARLFVNVGNAYAFAGDAGEAVLWYRRALLLDPHEPRATQGLELLRRQLPWVRPSRAGEDLVASLFFWHRGVSFGARRVLFLLLWPAAFALLAAGRRRRVLTAPGALAAAAGLALAASLLLSAADEDWRRQGVLLATVGGRTGDGEVYGPSHSAPLPAGSEVVLLEQRGDWTHVELPDATRAWVPGSAVAQVAAGPHP